MTITELIATLKTLPNQDAKVRVRCGYGSFVELEHITAYDFAGDPSEPCVDLGNGR